MKHHNGLTLIELIVTMAIISIMAAAAMPYVEITVTRNKELELKSSLREIRNAIDRFHDDWLAGKIAKTADGVSDNGYPKELSILVKGIEPSSAKGVKLKYLRRVPDDPFDASSSKQGQGWAMRGYEDEPDAQSWNGKDVYDVNSKSDKKAIDGSLYKEW